MTALGEILRRFRFHGVPGAPSAVAVPADRAAGLEQELAPVFAALLETLESSNAVVSTAEREAERRRTDAQHNAHGLVQEARSGAAAARSQAAAARLVEADAECRRILVEGHREAERVARDAADRTPALVEQVVTHVLAPPAARGGQRL